MNLNFKLVVTAIFPNGQLNRVARFLFNANKASFFVGRYFFLGLFFAAIYLIFSSRAAAQDLATINQLARDGAPGLALTLLDAVQPVPDSNLEGWIFIERQRVDIMRHWKQWDAIVQRLRTLPAIVPYEFEVWVRLEVINAFLQQKKGGAARALLRDLIWTTDTTGIKSEVLALCRRLIIRSYLVDDRINDAQRAMLRYQQDYGNSGDAWRLLRARVLLRIGRPDEAVILLEKHSEIEAVVLRLLAQLRAGQRTPESVLGDARTLLKQKENHVLDQARVWVVAAEAAAKMNSPVTRLRVLEQAVLVAEHIPADDMIFKVEVDQLWKVYEEYALEEANQMQLLIGQDERWLIEADKWHKSDIEKAKAFYSLIMFKGRSETIRDTATSGFIELVLRQEKGIVLLKKLVMESTRFPTLNNVPNRMRYVLIDDALASSDIDTATRLMSDLEKPPDNADTFEWGLRRARVLILGGQYQVGNTVLLQLFDQQSELTADQLDRALQVVFDLQTVGKHKEALALFEHLRKRPLTDQTHRELLFWMADSYRSLAELSLAAAYYLRSATLIDGFGLDPWGQTAKFRAAEVLTEAGLIEDARRIYENLMRVTTAADRRAVLKYKLQELWLKSRQQ